ncbi:phosphoribosylformylglycinamidine synthase [candidate division WOR-1 bacterium RIFOXYB2_FULL_42_35]|uniref:Phosphoribosylformylglycinamidine synthase subunit PurS n=1 Tax=candidate division WOR-1 bacterium RIFOXYC2_FULL_41_25 TaxID=1802586 RepID=A0A1F4TMQ9_UNCSA|nr:MAG: phosphoribosylformylglycinamidine synthase [candidate division WOR-1 bacterium RIFOXYA2_FULL_41_14]OGC24309.1 MAG: phosphoribosylformylglycinamidine synthase [candidate division WOR-1 bacterium RIFOXYB2_FULL_42_35]OGC34011.1 MAG: phosphoribosylformylglycinamidine synthase [candidate division WOR-1 bacterium RIFOXYC2_FULL_41_25]
MFEAEIKISLKKTVADPQGLTIKHALESLDFKGLNEVRMGKLVRIRLEAQDQAQAQDEVKQMCEKLLANQIIEDFSFKVEQL